jgi:hypothetical protein
MKVLVLKTKFVFTWAVLSALLIALPAHAASAGGGIVGSPNDRLVESDTECAGCPAAPGQVPQLSFNKAEALFAQGTAPTAEILKGSWNLVLLVRNPAETWMYGKLSGGSYPDGAKNSDGSNYRTLEFSSELSTWTKEQVSTVSLHDLGSPGSDQGPFEVTFRGQSACFAQYAYQLGGLESFKYDRTVREPSHPVNDMTFSYSCQLVGKDRMLCAVSSHYEALKRSHRNRSGLVIEYVGYQKVQAEKK